MDGQDTSIDKLLHDMRERAKELNCLYQVEELLSMTHLPLEDIFAQVIKAVPPGYQFPDI
jgi:pyruvate,water dikinase